MHGNCVKSFHVSGSSQGTVVSNLVFQEKCLFLPPRVPCTDILFFLPVNPHLSKEQKSTVVHYKTGIGSCPRVPCTEFVFILSVDPRKGMEKYYVPRNVFLFPFLYVFHARNLRLFFQTIQISAINCRR
jgi:hypothetical protein